MATRRDRRESKGILHDFLEWVGLLGFIYGPLDRRLSVRDALEKALSRPIPHISWWGCFGGISLFLFLVQIGTGVVLMFFYVPTDPEAYHSIRYLNGTAPFGWLVRSTHHWSGNGMIFALFIHVIRVFVTGAYQRPRDLNWMVGMALFLFTLSFALTGYLLPWSQTAFWTTVFWTDMIGQIPIVGQWLLVLIRGGELVSGATLTRFYAMHVAVLPILTIVFMAIHFAIIRRLGIKEPL
ncbi:MAG: cytochrome b N-terminal domain-containing protein [bacterium]|nr:MAG: cytochrome b N-terminal domain-containing protein [bacterium]